MVVNGTDVLVRVNDRTRGVVFARHLSMSAPDLTSAEWIAEAPSSCSDSGFCPQLPLTRFTKLTFSRAFATGNDAAGPISSPSWISTALQLVPRGPHRYFGDRKDPTGVSGAAGATPSPLTEGGSGFSITWQANPALAATVATATTRSRQPTVASALAGLDLSAGVTRSERGGCSHATTAGFRAVPVSLSAFGVFSRFRPGRCSAGCPSWPRRS